MGPACLIDNQLNPACMRPLHKARNAACINQRHLRAHSPPPSHFGSSESPPLIDSSLGSAMSSPTGTMRLKMAFDSSLSVIASSLNLRRGMSQRWMAGSRERDSERCFIYVAFTTRFTLQKIG